MSKYSLELEAERVYKPGVYKIEKEPEPSYYGKYGNGNYYDMYNLKDGVDDIWTRN